MTKASAARIARRGRPRGSTVPIERDRQKFEVAIAWGFGLAGYGPTVSAYCAAWATSNKPIQLEDVEGLLTVAGTEIPRTASSLEKHIDALARKAKGTRQTEWLASSALAIKALILSARIKNTEVYCGMLDILIGLGWGEVIERLSARIIEAAKSNIPPREGELGRQGQALLDWLRSTMPEKPK